MLERRRQRTNGHYLTLCITKIGRRLMIRVTPSEKYAALVIASKKWTTWVITELVLLVINRLLEGLCKDLCGSGGLIRDNL